MFYLPEPVNIPIKLCPYLAKDGSDVFLVSYFTVSGDGQQSSSHMATFKGQGPIDFQYKTVLAF